MKFSQHDHSGQRPTTRERWRRSAGFSALVLLTTGSLLSAATAGAATTNHRNVEALTSAAASAYVYNNSPGRSSYTPEKDYRFNSSGQSTTITRSGTGLYVIEFFGLGSVAGGGTVDVTAEGENNPAFCSVLSWGPSGSNLDVSVECYKPSGARVDTFFMAAFTSGGDTTGTVDYVWADNDTSKSYTPNTSYQFNSSGGTNTITRSHAGEYAVSLPGPAVFDGTVKVTAFGHGTASCQVDGWTPDSSGQIVDVDCFNFNGILVNHEFTMTFAASDSLLGDGGANGYAWANEPTSSSYTPDTTYQYDWVGSTATASSFGTGDYILAFPDASLGDHGDEQATAYGDTEAHCIVDGPAGTAGGSQGADVFCFDHNGNPVNTDFTVQWMVN
jgi:hypothetical protein